MRNQMVRSCPALSTWSCFLPAAGDRRSQVEEDDLPWWVGVVTKESLLLSTTVGTGWGARGGIATGCHDDTSLFSHPWVLEMFCWFMN